MLGKDALLTTATIGQACWPSHTVLSKSQLAVITEGLEADFVEGWNGN